MHAWHVNGAAAASLTTSQQQQEEKSTSTLARASAVFDGTRREPADGARTGCQRNKVERTGTTLG